ncbi:nucleoside hydrolase [Mycetocola lacteus]|uniref:Nucleoside hydrolase n=1 Tax=Mycetocola lacteus TaxID=76637 RepID=A0A3L7AKW0_9MICO|nr:nucleoside hydrolase [Mycetocola lacteus]RLP80208.1 nucleoside hydrolase [Mycetocola lacteus]
MTSLHHVILDTDIGSDVDDALALSQLLGTSNVTLLGVTTVYGDTLLRGRLARRLAGMAGRDIPVYSGLRETMSGREVWWPGHEGSLHPNLERESVHEGEAIRFLVDTVTARPGEIDVIAIGPLTNIAAAIQAHPDFASSVRHLWIMGGAFTSTEPEHNFRSDITATNIVFGAGIPTTVTGLEVTRKIEIRADQLEEIGRSGELGAALRADVQQWWDYWNETWNVPHDPVTVLTMTRPDLFGFSPQGRIEMIEGGEEDGRSLFHLDAAGTVRVATDVDGVAVGEEIVTAIGIAGAAKG